MAKNIVTLDLDNTSYELRPYGVCSTAAGIAAKTVSVSDFNLCTGATVLVKFDETNTAVDLTLNVNSTGAKSIKNTHDRDLNKFMAGEVYEFRYNGSQWDIINKSMRMEKRYYEVNLTQLSSSNFYPVIFVSSDYVTDCEIHSPNLQGGQPYNQNTIHFLYQSHGWSDTPKIFKVLSYGVYSSNELTIGAIGGGTQNGYQCVWLRGGLLYRFLCNKTPLLQTSDYVLGAEKYTVGTNFDGGTNAEVTIVWKADQADYNSSEVLSGFATSSKLGGIKIGYTQSGQNYPIQLDSTKKAYVNVPWTDTKNTAGSTNSTSKLYLIGATSQGANPQTYSNSAVYATNGELTASKFIGPLTGNAATATTATKAIQDGNGNNIVNTYAKRIGFTLAANKYAKIKGAGVFDAFVSVDSTLGECRHCSWWSSYGSGQSIRTKIRHIYKGTDIYVDESDSGPIIYVKAYTQSTNIRILTSSNEAFTIEQIDSVPTGVTNTSGNTYIIATLGDNVASATKATQDGDGNTISSTYLKTTGGQISSSATTPLSINSTSGTESGLRFDINKVSSGWVGYNSTNGIHLFSYKGGNKILGIKDDGTPHFSGNTLLHGANYTNYTVKKDGTGATGTWPISITGNAATATTATKVGTTTIGATNKPVYINAGTPTAVDSIGEAFLSWGGRAISGSISPVDTALDGQWASNRLSFMKAAGVTVQYRTDGVSTTDDSGWSDYGLSDTQKQSLVTTGLSCNIHPGKKTSGTTVNDRVRVIIDGNAGGIYFSLRKVFFYVSTNGVPNIACDIHIHNNGANAWAKIGSHSLSGYSGWNSIGLGNYSFGASTGSWASQKIMFIFYCQSVSGLASGQAPVISKISMHGETAWSAAGMAANGHMYTWDISKNVTFPAAVTATAFNGAATLFKTSSTRPTSSNTQYLDGAVRTYLSTSSMTTGKPATDGYIMQFAWDNSGYNSWLFVPSGGTQGLQYRTTKGLSATEIGDWRTVLDANNYTDYTVKKDGTGATGTWGINVSGSSGSCTGNAVTATTATKLGTANKGSATQPIYLNGGTPTACTYTLGATVPSNAVFTDTKVKQTGVVGSSNGTELLPLLLGTSGAFTSGNAGEAYYDSGVTLNPHTNTIAANISGNAQSANRLNYITIYSNSTYPTNGTSEYIRFGTINIPTTARYRSSIMFYFMDYEADWYQGDILSITSSTNASGVGTTPVASWQTKRQITTSDSIIISKVSDNKYNLYLEAKGSYITPKIYYMTSEAVGQDQVYDLFNASTWTSTAPTITSRSSLVNHSSHTNNLNKGAQGSIPYQTAANTTTFLAKGSAGYVLKMNSNATAPVWVSPYATSSTAGGFILGTTVTADAQNTARKYEVKLETSGHAYVNVPWTDNDTKYTHPTDGANTGSFGPSANASPAHGGTFSVPYITVNNKGHVTAVSTKTITLPADSNTDTKVKQTAKSDNIAYPLLLGPSSHTSGNAGEAYYDSGVTLNPSTNTIVANVSGSSGSCTGNAATATCIKKPGSYISALPTSTTTLTAGMTMGLVGSSTTNKPTNATYGNVIQIGGTGHSQLFLEWSGSNTATTGYMYYNSKRDMADTAWGGWKRILDERDLLTAVTQAEIESLF